MTCPVVGWCYVSIPRQERYGGGRIDRRRCPECGGPGRRMGGTSAVMAEHRPDATEAPDMSTGGASAPPGPSGGSQPV